MDPRTEKLLDYRNALDMPIEERDRIGCAGVPFGDLENFIANTYSVEQCAAGLVVRLEPDKDWTVAPAPRRAVDLFVKMLSLMSWNKPQPGGRK